MSRKYREEAEEFLEGVLDPQSEDIVVGHDELNGVLVNITLANTEKHSARIIRQLLKELDKQAPTTIEVMLNSRKELIDIVDNKMPDWYVNIGSKANPNLVNLKDLVLKELKNGMD